MKTHRWPGKGVMLAKPLPPIGVVGVGGAKLGGTDNVSSIPGLHTVRY